MERIKLREERDFGQKINATFLFLQQNFKPLFKTLLYYAGPLILLTGIFMGIYQSNLFHFDAGDRPEGENALRFLFSSVFNVNYVLALLLAVFSRLIVVGGTFAYMAEYLDNPGGEITPSMVWSRLSHCFTRLLLSSVAYLLLLLFIAGAIGLVSSFLLFGGVPLDMETVLPRVFLVPVAGLLVFVPVVYVAVKLCLFPAPLFIEDKGVTASFGRSWKLVKGKWWSTFGLVIIVSIIVAIVGVAFQVPLLLISFFREILQWEGGGSNQLIIILASVIGILGETLLYSIVNIALGFQYFNLAERQESIGLMEEIHSLGERTGDERTGDDAERNGRY